MPKQKTFGISNAFKNGWTLDTIPEDVLVDCAQLVKANSIEGNKNNGIKVVYTPASNLRKENGFDVGQLRYIKVERRINEIVNRLNKTKEDKKIDYDAEKSARIAAEKKRRKDDEGRRKAVEDQERRRKSEQDELQSYKTVFSDTTMSTNKRTGPVDPKKFEEDFF